MMYMNEMSRIRCLSAPLPSDGREDRMMATRQQHVGCAARRVGFEDDGAGGLRKIPVPGRSLFSRGETVWRGVVVMVRNASLPRWYHCDDVG